MAGVVCKYNKFGYCRFNGTCRNYHEDTNCDEKNCDTKYTKRHPRPCKFFEI